MSAHTGSTPSATRRKGILFVFAVLLMVIATACQAAPIATPAPATPATATPAPTAQPTPAPTATPPPATPAPTPTAAAFPVELVDFDGETVVIDARPERIISLTPAATETLFAIGAGDRVVGKMEDIANFPPEAADIPVVGSFAGVDVEQIVDLEPDLIIAGANGGNPQDTIEQMRDLDLPVIALYAADVEGVLADIELIGQATGDGQAAQELTDAMRADFELVGEATADLPRPRVFYETGDQPALYGVAADSFIAAMIELAGGDPITTGSSTIWEMPVEQLVDADPQIIILGDSAYGVTADAVAARPGWADLTAVREGAIHPIDDIVVTRPGPRLTQGLMALVEAINPGLDLGS